MNVMTRLKMIKTITTYIATVSVLALCGCQPTDENKNAEQSTAQQPLISGIDQAGMNKDIRPQDNFFEYVNGTWLSTTEIPADKSAWGTFSILHEQSLKQLQAIIQNVSQASNSSGSEISKASVQISNFYNAYMNEDGVNQLGISPIKEDLGTIDNLDSHNAVAAYLGKLNQIGVDSPLSFWVDQDGKDTTQYIVYLSQSGLGMPDRDYYFDDTDRGKELRAAYVDYVSKLLALAGFDNNDDMAERIMALETEIAQHQWTKVDNRDRDKTYNKMAIADLNATMPNYNLDALFSNLGIPPQAHFIVRQPSYIKKLNTLFQNTDLHTWKDYLRLRLIASFSYYLPVDFVDTQFEFYGKALRGQLEQQPRWKRAINGINGNMGELLGQLYVTKHFPPKAKIRMVKLVDNLQRAYEQSIKQLDWMGEATRRAALEKLAKFTPKIGYPDKWRDYSNLNVSADDLLNNIKNVRTFNHRYGISKLGKPINRQEWFMSPQTVNAYYNPSMNEIVFPAAILQPPFFNLDADDAVNYGAIGGVIGHEIGHGFDDQGSKSDGDGNLVNWWTENDRALFKKRTNALVKQYSGFEPLPGIPINGELTLGENIGDLGGLSIAYKAYILSLNGKKAPTIDGFTGEQRVFLGWAQAWRTKLRDKALEQRIKTDPHSPARYRVNGVVTNIETFYEAFNLKQGDKHYLAPQDRVKIW